MGWTDWVSDGAQAGTTGLHCGIEAVAIKLVNAPSGWHIRYMIRQAYWDWSGNSYIYSDGVEAGTTGIHCPIMEIKIGLQRKDQMFLSLNEPWQ